MFNSPSEAKDYEKKVRQNVDSLLSAFEGGNYTNAIAVLDWMKLAVAEKSCVANVNYSVTSSSPSFPLKVINLKE
ncbi:hypothetical protein [Pantoea dispersa]|uniref:hypothetical protein n=1 Tax=Pantoea dispersa TaxID=59814 RepID=UPI00128ECEC2|nr:hypothetical protein [Pantoea dispersa]